MVELTKFLKFLVVSNLLLLVACDNNSDNKSEKDITDTIEIVKPSTPMTKEDSIIQLAEELNIELNIEFNLEEENIHDVLEKVLLAKNSLISRLDSLDKRADEMEMAAIRYKKKENTELRNKLLSEIDRIKAELERIKDLSGLTDDIIQQDKNSIPEIKIPDMTSTFENLPAGNYVTRIDQYRIVSIYVSPNGEIIVGQPKIDSTTVIHGKKLDSRITKELEQIKEKLKSQ